MRRGSFIASWQFAPGFASALGVMGGSVYVASSMLRPTVIPPNSFTCTVTKVHDGDGPIWCAEGPKVRLHAVAARELDETCSPGHPCPDASGADARRALQKLAGGQRLRCEATGTSYDRITAWCWREDGVELNCAMVKAGQALRWEKFDRDRRMCR